MLLGWVGGENVHYIYINIYNIYFVMQYTVCIYVCVCVCKFVYTHANSFWKRTLNALLAKHCGVQT